MAAKTAAQEEFDNLIEANTNGSRSRIHPEDRHDHDDEDKDELDEETEFRNGQVDDAMRMPVFDRGRGVSAYTLPHQSFDSGRTTGVKGVIADARSYEMARRDGSWRGKLRSVSGHRLGSRIGGKSKDRSKKSAGDSYLNSDSEEDEEFLEQWRESRRQEIQREGNDIRNRRTSPSVRRFGRFDEVDALGYLDAIEKVGRETVVVVFVYDHEVCVLRSPLFLFYANMTQCPVSQVIDTALTPLVATNPAIHFVKVHYEDIEFDNAGVPAILAYKNQGDLFANLTYIIDQIPDDTLFDTAALRDVLKKHNIM
jgi:hypothetical protein